MFNWLRKKKKPIITETLVFDQKADFKDDEFVEEMRKEALEVKYQNTIHPMPTDEEFESVWDNENEKFLDEDLTEEEYENKGWRRVDSVKKPPQTITVKNICYFLIAFIVGWTIGQLI